jgi:hypothetical protein
MSAPTEVGHLRGMGDTTIGAALSCGGRAAPILQRSYSQDYEDWLINEVYTAPPVYAAPVYTAPPVYAVPAPLYGYYAAPYGYPPGSREWVIERGW